MPLYRWTDHRAVPSFADSRKRVVDGRLRFATREGLWWTVTEEQPADRAAPVTDRVPGARGRGMLLFECDTMRHRVRDYPADWSSLSADALEELAIAP